jgi:superfamily I DNA/RNA helicase
MNLTEEQKVIVDYEGDLSVRAGAGTGKTSTVTSYFMRRPNAPSLYLVYNKSVKTEAIHKFRKAGLKNVRVETLHSLAHSEMKAKRTIDLHEKGQYKPLELVELLGLGKKSQQFGLIMATHILNFMNYYCNSAYRKLEEAREDYLDTIRHAEFRQFAGSHYDTIVGHAGRFLKKMYEGDTPLTHDAYLKFYIMDNPQLPYEYIAVDEAQDTTMALLDMLNKQKSKRILVGDSSQSVYGFRFCVDSMSLMGFPMLNLTTSFRFGQNIANMAMNVLQQKSRFGLEGGDQKIVGAGKGTESTQVGVIARSNVLLLAQAIMDMENGVTKNARIGFEGGLKAYTFFGGSGLHDVLWLYCKKPEKVFDPFLKTFKSFSALLEFQQSVDDKELKTLIGIVQTFGAGLFGQISELKARQVEDRNTAELLYTSGHRSKGLQYPHTMLLGFIDQWDIEDVLRTGEYPKRSPQDVKDGKESQGLDLNALNQELNLSYVAITRAEKSVEILPEPFAEVSEMVKANKKKYDDSVAMGKVVIAKGKKKKSE